MPNLTWPERPEQVPSMLTIEPSAQPGLYKFSINDQNISRWIKNADILLFNRRDGLQPAEINIRTPVQVPLEIKVILFTGEKTNGNSKV